MRSIISDYQSDAQDAQIKFTPQQEELAIREAHEEMERQHRIDMKLERFQKQIKQGSRIISYND